MVCNEGRNLGDEFRLNFHSEIQYSEKCSSFIGSTNGNVKEIYQRIDFFPRNSFYAIVIVAAFLVQYSIYLPTLARSFSEIFWFGFLLLLLKQFQWGKKVLI